MMVLTVPVLVSLTSKLVLMVRFPVRVWLLRRAAKNISSRTTCECICMFFFVPPPPPFGVLWGTSGKIAGQPLHNPRSAPPPVFKRKLADLPLPSSDPASLFPAPEHEKL